jgi:hypothetical protein
LSNFHCLCVCAEEAKSKRTVCRCEGLLVTLRRRTQHWCRTQTKSNASKDTRYLSLLSLSLSLSLYPRVISMQIVFDFTDNSSSVDHAYRTILLNPERSVEDWVPLSLPLYLSYSSPLSFLDILSERNHAGIDTCKPTECPRISRTDATPRQKCNQIL